MKNKSMKKIIEFFRSRFFVRKLSLQKLEKKEQSMKVVTRKYKADIALTFNGQKIAKFPVSITAVNSAAAKNEILYKLGFEVIRVKQAD